MATLPEPLAADGPWPYGEHEVAESEEDIPVIAAALRTRAEAVIALHEHSRTPEIRVHREKLPSGDTRVWCVCRVAKGGGE